VLGIGIAQQHLVAVAHEPRADRPADCPRSHDDVLHRPTLIARSAGCSREDLEGLTRLVSMKLGLLLTTFAFGVVLLALGGWLVQGLRATPRLLVAR